MLEDIHIYEHLRLNGKTLNNNDFVFAFDQSVAQGNSSFISSLRYKDESLAGTTLVGEETFAEYKDIVVALFKEMAKSLRENKFDIFPRFKKENDGVCERCSYHDICYVKKEQYNFVKKDDAEEEDAL